MEVGGYSMPTFSSVLIRQMWEEHQQECDRQDRIIEAQMQAEEELREDRRKYPLFYWKELTSGNP
ncbi:hypothetical protein LCGC14_0404450 [marine sediment metagenome]|uniref:Uncharacterized protein n=1 Tax=marine sediment metagenome TaxID=412755 RepID=A0A0F9VHZ9_9ZZZZ